MSYDPFKYLIISIKTHEVNANPNTRSKSTDPFHHQPVVVWPFSLFYLFFQNSHMEVLIFIVRKKM